jgi:energy-coupling factor transporter ATP-binding protein EcfA2
MLVGFIYSENKFYMFDESLSQVSADYRPRLSKFLQEFCQVHGFTIILVSHTEELDLHADLIYVLSGSYDVYNVPVLNIDEKIGTYPKDNYIYAKIQNFQSIVNLEFRFKGFTIIRGSNNIGKSATLRAINSVLFNDFDKNMQRITNERSIETIIEFGQSDDETKKIIVSYKSQKVVYEFDGMKFAGKNLAFDKVKEKIESIGFKYINLKETYKNFKGNLKDQTERLSLTTQHDGLFLIGAKNTDSSKIFDFLFDSYQVAGAIARVKIDINNKINEFNDCSIRIIENQKTLDIESIKEKYYSYKYYNCLISDVSIVNNKLNIINHRLTLLNQVYSFISSILYIDQMNKYIAQIQYKISSIDSSSNMQQIQILDKLITSVRNILLIENSISKLFSLNRISTTLNKLISQKEIIENILSYMSWLKVINDNLKVIDRLNVINSISKGIENSINNYNQIIINCRSILQREQNVKYIMDSINYIQNTKIAIQEKQTNIEMMQTNLNNLGSEFGLTKCSSCSGIGYTHIH